MPGTMDSYLSSVELFSQRLRDLTVSPETDWSHLFSPTINFGCNIDDLAVEEKVLNSVGSYGKQINAINDVLTVLLRRLRRDNLTADERTAVNEFEAMAAKADECAAKANGKAPGTMYALSPAEIEQMIDRKVSEALQRSSVK